MSFIKFEFADRIRYMSTTSNLEFDIKIYSPLINGAYVKKYRLTVGYWEKYECVRPINYDFDSMKEAEEFADDHIKQINNRDINKHNKQLLEKIDELIECIKYLPTTEIAGSEFKIAQKSAIERGFKP